jgi:hypothetical protein
MSVVAGLEEEAASCYEATLELFADLQQVFPLHIFFKKKF